jgi:hypothetical protein
LSKMSLGGNLRRWNNRGARGWDSMAERRGNPEPLNWVRRRVFAEGFRPPGVSPPGGSPPPSR